MAGYLQSLYKYKAMNHICMNKATVAQNGYVADPFQTYQGSKWNDS